MKIGPLNISLAPKKETVPTAIVGGISIPRGRISIPDETSTFGSLISEASNYLAFVNPKVPIDFLDIISKLCLSCPDFAQAVSNIVFLGNNGHQVLITADSSRKMTKAVTRLNELGTRIRIEDLLNALFYQITVYGALSLEWIVKLNLSGIDTYAMVPVRSIRFKYDREANRWLPHQYTSKGEYILLNEATYVYSALLRDENSPYAIPPFIPALSNAITQIYMMDNIKFITKKMGLLGFVDLVLKMPSRNSGETDALYKARLQTYLTDCSNAFAENYRDGIAGHYDDMTLNHHPVSADAAGAKEILQMNEEQMISGLKQDPAMLGRSYSTTETYAGVVYSKMVNEIDNYRRQVKGAIELGYRLELLMAGMAIDSLSLDFSGNSSFKPMEEATASKTQTDDLILQMDAGLISADQAAQAKGYEKAYQGEYAPDSGAESFSATLKWTSRGYKLIKERIPLSGGTAEGELAGSPNTGETDLASEKGIESRRLRWVGEYLKKVEGVEGPIRQTITAEVKKKLRDGDFDSATPEGFAEGIYQHVAKRHPEALKTAGLKQTVKASVTNIFSYYRLRDKIIGNVRIPSKLALPDRRAIEFLHGLDDFYISGYLKNEGAKGRIMKFLQTEYLEGGHSEIDGFAKKFAKEFSSVSKSQMQMIADTAVTRLRTAGHVRQLASYDIVSGEVVEVMDRITCPICREMDGKTFSVKVANDRLEELYSLSAEEFDKQVYKNAPAGWKADSVKYAKGKTADELIRENIVGPPYHSRCRGRLVAG